MTFTPSHPGGHLSIMKRTSRIQMKPQASSSSIGLRQAHAASSANLIVPRRKFADHSGYLFRIRTFPKTRFEIAHSEQPPDKPVVVRVKPAVLDLGKCTGTKMVPRAKHGGVRDQKKNPGNEKERIQPLHAVPVASRAQLHGRWTM